jgi:FkbM family methyltransferase
MPIPKKPRPVAFVLAATGHGSMIVNRLDYATTPTGGRYGVGIQMLDVGAFDPEEVDLLLQLLDLRRKHFGDGIVAVDCGANIGVHTVEWAAHMAGWGSVIAIEAQERIYYALAGNIAINNCFNARAINVAVGAKPGSIRVPKPNYLAPGSFGSLELRYSERTEFIGQAIDYGEASTVELPMTTIDALGLSSLDLLKIDVEGMEVDVLEGAAGTLAEYRPIIVAEHIKVGRDRLIERLSPLGYRLLLTRMNLIAVHPSDPSNAEIRLAGD